MNKVKNIKEKALFVTGTDTGIGKTVICGCLLNFLSNQGIKTGYQKWVSSGGKNPEDLYFCRKMGSLPDDDTDLQVPYHFFMAASPHLAAEQERRMVDPEILKKAFKMQLEKFDILLVEGAGGIFVPLNRQLLLADFVRQMDVTCLVVARSGLGTINHTLLTIEALQNRNIHVLGVVVNDEMEESNEMIVTDNMKIIEDFGNVTVFGRMPRCASLEMMKKEFEPIGQEILNQIFDHNPA